MNKEEIERYIFKDNDLTDKEREELLDNIKE